jgi:predicted PurR-regulated permease PerM
MTLDADNDLAEKFGARSPSFRKDFNTTDYVMSVVLMTLAVLAAVVFTVFFYKKHSEFWKWTYFRYYRHNNQMDIHLDDMHNIVFIYA